MQYKDVKKKIIVEEYLDAGSDKLPEDYKFYCMNGVCRTIMVCKDRKIGEKARYFFMSRDWTLFPYTVEAIESPNEFIPKPECINTAMIMTTAAVLGGSVCGDHISPISDTTILSSTGAECNHINHVESQMQYGFVVAFASFIMYLLAGLTNSQILGFGCGMVILLAFVLLVKGFYTKKGKA